MLPSPYGSSAEAISTILIDCSLLVAVKIELIVSRKAEYWTIVCTKLLALTFPSAVFLLTLQRAHVMRTVFPRGCCYCASDINI